MNRIHYVKPSITPLEISLATEAASNSWGENAGSFVAQFEQEFSTQIGSKFAVATSSCTGALELGLASLGLDAGDEIILADTNWVATVSPLIHHQLKPVFVDIKSDTWCIDPMEIESKITSRTRGVIATHLYGNACDLSVIQEICHRRNLFLIEDAAEAIGTYIESKHVGTFGKFGIFSFHGSKTLTCGEGGMLVTNDEALYQRVRQMNNHGRATNEVKQFWATAVGHKFRMSDVQAAIGLGQVRRFSELTSRKREILDRYRVLFKGLDGLQINPVMPNVINGSWMPNIVFSEQLSVNIDELRLHLNDLEIDARVFFWPLTSMEIFGSEFDCPNAKSIASRSLNLPSFHDMTDHDQGRVFEAIIGFLRGKNAKY